MNHMHFGPGVLNDEEIVAARLNNAERFMANGLEVTWKDGDYFIKDGKMKVPIY